jgi:c-di-AMP phosphodiesterase-like protein
MSAESQVVNSVIFSAFTIAEFIFLHRHTRTNRFLFFFSFEWGIDEKEKKKNLLNEVEEINREKRIEFSMAKKSE